MLSDSAADLTLIDGFIILINSTRHYNIETSSAAANRFAANHLHAGIV